MKDEDDNNSKIPEISTTNNSVSIKFQEEEGKIHGIIKLYFSKYLIIPIQIDTFITAPGFGVRLEIGVAIKEDGIEELCNPVGKIYELGF